MTKIKNSRLFSLRQKIVSRFGPKVAKKIIKDSSGNFAVISALVTSVIVTGTGGALDYSTIIKTKISAQDAADTAVLAGVSAAGSFNEKEAIAKNTFLLNSPTSKMNSDSITISSEEFKSLSNGAYEYKVDIKYKPLFLQVVGIKEVDTGVRSVAVGEASDIDIVFVLDSSGSMATSDGSTTRMAELKKSVKLFLSSFESGGSVKAALVPFDTQVKIENAIMTSSSTTYAQNPYESTGSCSSIVDPIDREACEDNNTVYYADCSKINNDFRVDDEFDTEMCLRQGDGFRFDSTGAYAEALADSYQYVATTSSGRHRIMRYVGDKCTIVHNRNTAECVGFVPDRSGQYIYDEPAPGSSGPSPSTSKDNDEMTPTNDLLVRLTEAWSGCIIDRTQEYDVSATPPKATEPETLYPKAHCALNSLKSIEPLTNNLNHISLDVDQLSPNGNTNLTIGIQWGMEAFTPTTPLTGGRTGENVKRIMILLTDGENTQNRWWGGDRSSDIDARARLACDNAKALDAEIYAVRLIGGNENLLKHCAQDKAHYFNVVKASELAGVLGQIASDIKQIRLTH